MLPCCFSVKAPPGSVPMLAKGGNEAFSACTQDGPGSDCRPRRVRLSRSGRAAAAEGDSASAPVIAAVMTAPVGSIDGISPISGAVTTGQQVHQCYFFDC